MKYARPLPSYLVKRYHGWKDTTYSENSARFKRLAKEGQPPRAMVISCCDSRVQVQSIFGADQGELFIHLNIANLVPPFNPDGEYRGTSAAVEFAVASLKVPHLIVLGHSRCGGVKACHDMCCGRAPDLEATTSFIGRWMDILRPSFDEVRDIKDETDRLTAFEKKAVLVSLQNLLTFPFVQTAVDAGDLALHGAWMNIADGGLEAFDPVEQKFSAV